MGDGDNQSLSRFFHEKSRNRAGHFFRDSSQSSECLRNGWYSAKGYVPSEDELIRKCFAGRGLNDIIKV